jgi:hypothetical protein
MRTRPTILGWSLLLAACNDPASGPLDVPEFRVSPTETWSGGTATIVSDYFNDRSIPVIRVDTVPLAVTRVDDSTISLALPPLPSGTYPVLINDRNLPGPIVFIELVGFRAHRVVSPGVGGKLVSARLANGPVVIGNLGSGIGVLSPSTGLIIKYPTLSPPSLGSGYNIAPSYRGTDVFVLRDTSLIVGEWRLWTVPTFLDTVASGFQGGFTRHVVSLAPDVYLITGSHTTTSYSPTGQRYFTTESVWANFLSPAGNRALIGSSASVPGAQVIDMTTGDTAYTLPLSRSLGAAFSTDGAWLYASGGPLSTLNSNEVVKVDATTGAVVSHDSAPADVLKWAMGLSLSGQRLFVAGERNSLPVLLVYDTETMALIGTLEVPASESEDCFFFCWQGAITVDDPYGKVYYTLPGSTWENRVYEFDILPE